MYITPFLSEIDERVPQELPELNFKSPVNTGNGKMGSLASLVEKGENVASTHALFSMLTKEIVEKLIEGFWAKPPVRRVSFRPLSIAR